MCWLLFKPWYACPSFCNHYKCITHRERDMPLTYNQEKKTFTLFFDDATCIYHHDIWSVYNLTVSFSLEDKL